MRIAVVLGLLLVVLAGAGRTCGADEIVIRADDQFNYGRQLLETGEYRQALGELERFRHFFPDDARVSEARYLEGLCLLRLREFDAARKVFAALLDAPDRGLAGRALFLSGESYYAQGRPEQAEALFRETAARYPDLELKNLALYRLGWSQMQQGRWQTAAESFRDVTPASSFYATAQDLARRSLAGEGLPYKDPTQAGVMAGVLPGLGHAYVGRYRDAAVALLLNGLFIWAAIEAFDADQNVLGGILAFLELGFYTGNIYSAVNCTHKYNRQLADDFRQGLNDPLDWRLFASQGRRAGLTLAWRFP